MVSKENIDFDDDENVSFESNVSNDSVPEYEPDAKCTGEITSDNDSVDGGEAAAQNELFQVTTDEAESYTCKKVLV